MPLVVSRSPASSDERTEASIGSVPLDFLAALDSSWDGLALVDVNGLVTWSNRILSSWVNERELPSWADAKRLPRSLEGLFVEADQGAVKAAYQRMLASGMERFEAQPSGPVSRRFLCTLTARGSDEYRGALLVVHDIERGRGGSLEEATRLRELNEARTRFINTAAHEFSTPLTPLRLQTFLLRTGRLGPMARQQADSVEILDRNMERLSKLVQDVLDVARLGADRLIVEKEPIDFGEVARHATASLQAAAQHKGLELSVDVPGTIDVLGDADRLTQVLVNLLHNAIKFTPAGGRVTVRATLQAQRVRVDVTDTGLGLGPEEIPLLFQPFSQGKASQAAHVEGSGLGLSISRGIVAQHGGRMWCQSDGHGRGATFSFDLPLREPVAATTESIGIALYSPGAEKRGEWTLVYFRCPQCGSRDLEVRLLRNRYDCNSCGYVWR